MDKWVELNEAQASLDSCDEPPRDCPDCGGFGYYTCADLPGYAPAETCDTCEGSGVAP